jgi:hypothetical protein
MYGFDVKLKNRIKCCKDGSVSEWHYRSETLSPTKTELKTVHYVPVNPQQPKFT